MNSHDTIVAISSAVGALAGRVIVRLSGPDALRIACGLVDELPTAGHAARTRLRFAGLIAPAWLYLFAGPRSYTGQDLVEFHLPGCALLARMLLDAITAAGARHAEPGEFTARAYFSGRMDLTEAEGVAATIAAHNRQELRAARQLLAGDLARRLRPEMDHLAETLALVEAGIDFSDEGVSFLSPADLRQRIERVDSAMDDLVAQSARFEPLTHEPVIVLVGRPNAGKSTLLNALAGHERAVVSPVAGTTRDVLSAEVTLPRGMVRMLDVAGLESDELAPPDADHDSAPTITAQMRRQALRALEEADHMVLVRDLADDRPPLALPRAADLTVKSKCDQQRGDAQSDDARDGLALTPSPGTPGEGWGGGLSTDYWVGPHPGPPPEYRGRELECKTSGGEEILAVSAVTGENLDRLQSRLDELAFGRRTSSSTLALNARHLTEIAEARQALNRAAALADGGQSELIALELREALDALGRVLGQVTPDDVLGRIFSTFCIGK